MPTFVLIGHCGPDAYLLRSAVARAVPGATFVTAHDEQALISAPIHDRVLLINRVLDDGFSVDNGVRLIERLSKARPGVVMMLVSNHEDAQAEAEAAGAMPGFGKRQVHAAVTAERLAEAAVAASFADDPQAAGS